MENEVVEIITDELIDFFASYIVMTSMTHGMMETMITEDQILYEPRKTGICKGNTLYSGRHAVIRNGRTKISFSFRFYRDELDFAMKLVRLLDGYIDYRFLASSSHYYSYYFEFDTGLQENAKNMFEKLKGIF